MPGALRAIIFDDKPTQAENEAEALALDSLIFPEYWTRQGSGDPPAGQFYSYPEPHPSGSGACMYPVCSEDPTMGGDWVEPFVAGLGMTVVDADVDEWRPPPVLP